MKLTHKQKEEQICIVLRRMREAVGLTMRQAGALISVSHSTISQFENGKLRLPDFRIEQLVSAYGYTPDDFARILGRSAAIDHLMECRKLIEKMSQDQLSVLYKVML